MCGNYMKYIFLFLIPIFANCTNTENYNQLILKENLYYSKYNMLFTGKVTEMLRENKKRKKRGQFIKFYKTGEILAK